MSYEDEMSLIKARISDKRSEIRRIEKEIEVQKTAACRAYLAHVGLAPGDRIRVQRPRGRLIDVSVTGAEWSWSEPCLLGFLVKKDGTPGEVGAVHIANGKWEKIE